jgi:hypothetical protein
MVSQNSQGAKAGRKKSLSPTDIAELRRDRRRWIETWAAKLGVSHMTIRRALTNDVNGRDQAVLDGSAKNQKKGQGAPLEVESDSPKVCGDNPSTLAHPDAESPAGACL